MFESQHNFENNNPIPEIEARLPEQFGPMEYENEIEMLVGSVRDGFGGGADHLEISEIIDRALNDQDKVFLREKAANPFNTTALKNAMPVEDKLREEIKKMLSETQEIAT